MPANTSPTFSIEGIGAEPSEAAVSALARLLLSLADADDVTPNKETAVSAT